MSNGVYRRDFLVGSAGAALGLGALGAQAARAESGPPRVRGRRKLGRTGLEMSDISYGSSRTTDPKVALHALERGINYFDTAEGYKGGASEEALGVALKGRRQDVILTSKTKVRIGSKLESMMSSLEGSLRRLRTDHVDIYLSHAVNDVEVLKSEEWQGFVAKAKQQGKIRFSGLSGHAGRLVECIEYAADHALADVILCAYNFGQDPAFHQRFTRSLCASYRARQTLTPTRYEKGLERNVTTLRQFDDVITAYYGRYRNAEDYYRSVSSGPRLDQIDRPTLVLGTDNDPFIPVENIAHWPHSKTVRVEITGGAGHVGFIGSSKAPRFFWAADRMLAFLQEIDSK